MLKSRKSQEVERLLESYILRSDFLPRDAHRIRSAPSVPKELRRLVMQAVKLGKAWSCWTVVMLDAWYSDVAVHRRNVSTIVA